MRIELEAPVLAFGVTLLLMWLLTRSGLAQMGLDQPNERSLHQNAIPRTGGLGLHAGVIVAWVYCGVPWSWLLMLAYAALIAVSIADDLRGLPAALRLVAHLVAALLVAVPLLSGKTDYLFVALVTLIVAWVTNLYNFMDGADGLAGGMAISGFVSYGLAGSFSGITPFALLNFSIAASALAFLLFNFSPAKIFMGDAGSIPLGFLAASLGLTGWNEGLWPWWFPAAVFAPFMMDASATLFRRLIARKPVWQAHREHAYQKLVLLGWSHRKLALRAYLLMFVCGAVALLGLSAPVVGQWCALPMVVMICAGTMLWVERAWHRRPADTPS